ncbi:MAG: DUF2807 domain-containing protein [Candidatus Cloacimonadales bacterium]
MGFYFGNRKVDNSLAKIILSILAIVIIIAVLGLVGIVLFPIAIFVVIVLIFVALIVPIAAVFGAGKWMKGIRGSGDIMTEIRDVLEFDCINLGICCELTVEQGETQELTIEADDNILGYILSYVQEGVLHINTKNSLIPNKKIIIQLTTPNFKNLTISGKASANLKNIKADDVRIKISGNGKASGQGKIERLELVISGVGDIKFKELKTHSTKLKISGKGSAELYVEDNLDALINGTGKANVWGKPKNVSKQINGLGKINII